MKGGVASALFALRALTQVGVRLRGDVIFEAVPDEETCAMGTVAAIERGYRADAGLVPEPTLLNLWIATRGLLHGSFEVPGRSAHAEVNQAPWEEGGGVNAIERAVPLLAALGRAERATGARATTSATRCSARRRPSPTIVSGGAFISNVPEALDRPPQRHLPAGRRRRRRLRQRAARGDRRRGRGPRGGATAGCARTPCAGRGRRTTRRPRSRPARTSWPRRARWRRRSALEGRPEGIDTTYDGALLTRLAGVPEPGLRAGRPRPCARAGRVDRDRGAAPGRARLRARAHPLVRCGMTRDEGRAR